ncbi:MAG: hypothetical protein J1E35_04620 [Lachnospiraceae bacterium]|nr:hypothetical protein [Lachnospiraceae bacterium]
MYRRKIAYLFAYRNGIREQSVGILRQYGEEEEPEVTLELLRRPEREERWSIYYFNRRDRLLEADFLWEISDGQKMSGVSVEQYRLCAEAGMGKGVVLLPESVGTARKASIEWPNTDFYLCGRYDGKEVTEAQVRAAFTNTGAGISEEKCASPAKKLFEEITKAAGGEETVKEEENRDSEQAEKKEKVVLKRKAVHNRVACLDEMLLTKPAYNPCREASLLYSVRISPEELSFLPKEGRRLAENSFLLHGYYYYRHLLLGKRRQKEQEDYVVLVPGMYLKRDICLAGLFGFFEFLPVQYAVSEAAAGRQGIFGYWCAKI